MCPSCIASAALVIGSVATTGGLTALFARAFRNKTRSKAVQPVPSHPQSKTNSERKR